jgi:hypothetical protein
VFSHLLVPRIGRVPPPAHHVSSVDMIQHFRETLRKIQHHPGGWLVEPRLASHIAFALTMDEGAGGNLLVGYREYLIGRVGNDMVVASVGAMADRADWPQGPRC